MAFCNKVITFKTDLAIKIIAFYTIFTYRLYNILKTIFTVRYIALLTFMS